MFRTRYREGITRQDSDLLRRLRARGFAVAIFPPAEVGQPINRKTIEDQMLRAGRQTIRNLEDQASDHRSQSR